MAQWVNAEVSIATNGKKLNSIVLFLPVLFTINTKIVVMFLLKLKT